MTTQPPDSHDAAPGQGLPAYPGHAGAVPYPNAGAVPYPGGPQQHGAAHPPQGGWAPPGPPGYLPRPGYPPPGGMGPVAPPPPTRPNSVMAAFWLWVTVAALSVISSILLVTGDYSSRITQMITDSGMTSSELNTAAGIADAVMVVSVVIGMVIALFVYGFFGIMMVRGRGWARIVLAAWSGLQILSAAASLSLADSDAMSVGMPAGNVTLSWIGAALAVIAIVLVFLPSSNRFFKQAQAYRWAMKPVFR